MAISAIGKYSTTGNLLPHYAPSVRRSQIATLSALPMRAEITGGEVSDYKGFDALHDDELPQAKVFIAEPWDLLLFSFLF